MSRKARVSTDNTKIFGERLSDLVNDRKKQGLSHNDIANDMKVSSGSLSEWCSDNVTASIDNLVTVAKYFGVSTDFLLGLTNFPTNKETKRGVCEKTGLSENAVDTLLFLDRCQEKYPKLNKPVPSRRFFLEKLLCYDEFDKICSDYLRYTYYKMLYNKQDEASKNLRYNQLREEMRCYEVFQTMSFFHFLNDQEISEDFFKEAL